MDVAIIKDSNCMGVYVYGVCMVCVCVCRVVDRQVFNVVYKTFCSWTSIFMIIIFQDLFSSFNVVSAEEMTLGANQKTADVNRLKWKIAGERGQ